MEASGGAQLSYGLPLSGPTSSAGTPYALDSVRYCLSEVEPGITLTKVTVYGEEVEVVSVGIVDVIERNQQRLYGAEFVDSIPSVERAKGNGCHPGVPDTGEKGFELIEGGRNRPAIGIKQGLIVENTNHFGGGAHAVKVDMPTCRRIP